jgi:PadR family transcriptional regulator, regulatory protein AphA
VTPSGPAGQRRTSLRFAILGLLTRRPATGYDIKRDFDRTIGYAWNAFDSQIYPELRRLEADGLVRAEAATPGGRRRRTYRVTTEGRRELRAWLAGPAERGFQRDEFLLRLFFFQLLAPGARADVLALEAERLEEELKLVRGVLDAFEGSEAAADVAHALRWQLAAAQVFEASAQARLAAVRQLLVETEATPHTPGPPLPKPSGL